MKNKPRKTQITLADVLKAEKAGAATETLKDLIRIGLEQALAGNLQLQ